MPNALAFRGSQSPSPHVSKTAFVSLIPCFFEYIHVNTYRPQKSREGWVSATTEGEGDSSCGCDDTATAAPGAAAATSDGKRHWDGVEPDHPTGRCPGDSHGPQCGHEVRAYHTRVLTDICDELYRIDRLLTDAVASRASTTYCNCRYQGALGGISVRSTRPLCWLSNIASYCSPPIIYCCRFCALCCVICLGYTNLINSLAMFISVCNQTDTFSSDGNIWSFCHRDPRLTLSLCSEKYRAVLPSALSSKRMCDSKRVHVYR